MSTLTLLPHTSVLQLHHSDVSEGVKALGNKGYTELLDIKWEITEGNHHHDSLHLLEVYLKILRLQWQVVKFYVFDYLNFLGDMAVKSVGH